MSLILCASEGKFIGIRRMKVGLLLCMKGYRIFVIGVGQFLMMIKIVRFGCKVRVRTLKLEEQQFGSWTRAPLFNIAKKSFVEVKGYEVVNHGVGGVMVSLDTQVPHGFLRLRQGFDNTITSSDSRATNENDMVPQSVDGILDDEEYVSSSVKLSETLLQAEKDDARVVPNIEE